MHIMRRLAFPMLLALALAAPTIHAQNRSVFGSRYNAIDYAYGIQPGIAGMSVNQGNSSTGTASITTVVSWTTIADGTRIYPFATNAPIIVGTGSTQETITPTSLSNCNFDAGYGTCTITASFTYTHGTGEILISGSMGLQEALNAAQGMGGGVVVVGRGWRRMGGTNTMISAAAGFSSVVIEDTSSGGPSYWTLQPSTLTSLAAPATLTNTTVTFSGTTGTWTNAAQFICVSYVDPLGGEGPCSATYNTTPSANTILTVTSPAASTGAVGWRAYAGTTYNGAYLLPITSAACTLTTLESTVPACAIGSAGTWPAIFVNTTTLRPNGQSPTVNLNLPFPQGHTTFAYQPSALPSQQFQTNYGPFPAFGSTTSGQTDVIGSVNLPTGYLNTIGRTVRISGKIAATVNTAAVPTVTVSLGWVAGTTAGAPVAVCTNAGAAYGSSAAYNLTFECTMTTNATGSSAATIMTKGLMGYNVAAGGAAGVITIDTGTAAIASLGLSQQDTVYVSYTSGTNTSSAVQLLDLHVETLQ